MTVQCSHCGYRMEFVRKHCPHCGITISNWFSRLLLMTLAVIFIGCVAIIAPYALIAKAIVVSILGIIYISQIAILIRD